MITIGPRSRRNDDALIPLQDALAALGHDGAMGTHDAEVGVSSIVGSAARSDDFDAEFRLRRPALRPRLDRVVSDLSAGRFPQPVQLVQLGELYFVRDGHHRVAAARTLGWDSLPARVTRVCTVAYAMCCLRAAHLRSKAAERRFLERIPVSDAVRRDLWLDEPADWVRLADSAESWAFRHGRSGPDAGHDLAGAWWDEEVLPVLARLRADGEGSALRDVQLYVTALAVRDELGSIDWPDDLAERVAAGHCCRS